MQTYEQTELNRHRSELRAIENAPLHERKESRQEFSDYLTLIQLPISNESIDDFAERVQWLIDGNYGYGAMQAAKRILEAKRSNRNAQLFQQIAALEFRVTQRDANSVWNSLPADIQTAINSRLSAIVAAYDAEAKTCN